MKAVVTGGAGFIGSHVVEALIQRGIEVQVIDDLSAGNRDYLPKEAVLSVCDVRDYDAMRPLFEGAHWVFHLAALPSVPYSIEHPQETHSINVTGTLNVLRAAVDAEVTKVVYSTSCAVYGDTEELPVAESVSTHPLSPYAAQKYIGEVYATAFAESYGLPVVCLRYFNVYGPRASAEGAYASVIGRFIELAKERAPLTITGDGEQTRDYVHVRDVAHANLCAAEAETGDGVQVINIGSGTESSVNTIARMIGGDTTYIEARKEIQRSCADATRARELLDWEPTITLEEGIAELKKQAGLV